MLSNDSFCNAKTFLWISLNTSQIFCKEKKQMHFWFCHQTNGVLEPFVLNEAYAACLSHSFEQSELGVESKLSKRWYFTIAVKYVCQYMEYMSSHSTSALEFQTWSGSHLCFGILQYVQGLYSDWLYSVA